MVVYYSILAYTCLISLFGCMVKRRSAVGFNEIAEHDKMQKSISLFFALISVALLVFFVGMRTNYADTAAYIKSFNNASVDFSTIKDIYNREDEGIGFVFLQMLFKRFISKDANAWLTFLAIFQAGALVSVYYRYSPNYALSMYLFIASTSFTWMMNGVRQFTAVCLFLYFIDYVIDRKLVRFLIILAIAYSIHTSAFLWLPIFFIVQFKPFSKYIWILVSLTLAIVFYVDSFTSLLDSALMGTEFEGAGSTLTSYADDDGANPIRVLISVVPPAIALWRWKYIKYNINDVIKVFINLSTVASGVYLIAMVTSGILVGRVPIYFTVTNFALLPWLFDNAFNGRTRAIIKAACIVLYFAYFYYVLRIMGFGNYTSTVLGITVV